MRTLSRVVWSEGMHLSQHHFQSQSRYFENLAGFVLSQLHFRPYGLAGCELDAEALLNGTVVVRHARGILPDGLAFHFPEDALPEPLPIRDRFLPTAESHLVHLALPGHRPNRANCIVEPGASVVDARFVSSAEPTPDEITGQDERPVPLARKNFRLLLDTDLTDDLVALPLARIRRDGAGHFIYDPEYVPPCVRIGASARLLELLARIVEILDAKSETLLQERRSAPGSAAEYASREIANFWLSNAIHSSLGPLRHHLQTRSSHPEALYLELVQLAGALCTFAMHSHPRDLPTYEHDRLEVCFGALEQHIRQHMEVVIPTNAASFPLLPAEPSFYVAAVNDRRMLNERVSWYLGVRSSAGQAETISRVPALVKVCSAKHIERLVREAFPGMTLTHVPTLPDAASPRAGMQYFAIHCAGPCWSSVQETAQVGVYVPDAVTDAELELVAVLES